jgi:hypothetical protein
MNKLIDFYKKHLGFNDYYSIILSNSCNNQSEFIQSNRLLKGFTAHKVQNREIIKSEIEDCRVDVPIWFGDLSNSKRRILIFGLEPRDTNADFNIEKIENKIFGSPFGIDRWNKLSSVKGKPQNRYYRVFRDLVFDEDNFVLFSDIVKDYTIYSTENVSRANDKAARKQFNTKAEKQLHIISEEIEIIAPTHIITLGADSYKFLSKIYPSITYRLRHPANGGEKKAKEMLNEILKTCP